MPCPRCGSHELWDDMAWWGCEDCGWTNGGTVWNTSDSRDRFNEKLRWDCRVKPASSRVCQRGTRGCDVDHEEK